MAVAFQLEAIEAGGDHSFRRIRVIPDDALDVPILHLLRKGAMAGSLTCDDETTGSQSPWAKLVRRPRWVSWIMTAQPYSWQSQRASSAKERSRP